METLFPFGFPAATTWYACLYVVTLIVHVIFMNYVLGGALYLVAALARTRSDDVRRVTGVLRDWTPFALGAAITAGVAPLLFVQVLYQVEFYTANLLLFHRWMAVVPVLIVGFYLTYLQKSGATATRWPRAARFVTLGACLSFLFAAYSFTENHLLSLDAGTWPSFYEARRWFFVNGPLVPRLAVWVFGSVPTMALLVAWQLHAGAARGEEGRGTSRELARTALGAIALSVIAAIVYGSRVDGGARHAVTGPLAAPYLALGVAGLLAQSAGWLALLRSGRLRPRLLGGITAGLVATLLGATVCREAVRLSALDLAPLFAHHAQAARERGVVVFVLFLLVNSAIIAGCVRLVRRASLSTSAR